MRLRSNVFNSLALAAAMISVALTGCQKSSSSTVRTYEYSDQGRSERPALRDEATREQPSSDYQMTSPGQMASPGEMTSPGRPVVQPRNNP